MTRAVARIGLIAAYAAGVAIGASLAGATLTPWFLAAWSVLFAVVYVRAAGGRAIAALATVAAATIVLPLAALTAMLASPASPFAAMAAAGSALVADGPRRIVELGGPLLAAAVGAWAVTQRGRRTA